MTRRKENTESQNSKYMHGLAHQDLEKGASGSME